MLVHECMTKSVQLASPDMSLREAAQKMKDGNFGFLPVGENDRLVGVVTDRDMVMRAIADGKDPEKTRIRDVMSEGTLYCFENEVLEEVAQNMGQNQVRRLPVLNEQKRMVGILSLGDISQSRTDCAGDALAEISRHEGSRPEWRKMA